MPKVDPQAELVPATERFSISDLVAALPGTPTSQQNWLWEISVMRPHNMITGSYAAHLKAYFEARNAIVLGKRVVTETRSGTRFGSLIAVLGPESLFPVDKVVTGENAWRIATANARELLGRLSHLNTLVTHIEGISLSAQRTRIGNTQWSTEGIWDETDAPSPRDYGELAFNALVHLVVSPVTLWSAARYYLS
jgi:hypothetical protein